MKLILLRGRGQTPIKITFDKWTLLMPMLFLLGLLMVIKSIISSFDSSELNSTHMMQESLYYMPATGGISGTSIEPNQKHVNERELLDSINQSEHKLALQSHRLNKFQEKLLENPISDLAMRIKEVGRNEMQTIPQLTAKPVDVGYISSRYGMRSDPINGKYRKHSGIDIAAKKGSVIRTMGSGFVTFAGRKGGYGKVIEIHHSDSLKSRYAHLDKILVEEGDVVRKGIQIAKMGRTGRATGSHLHLEVWQNGIAVNPEDYVDLILHR